MVVLFLAANVWLLYAYRAWIMRHPTEPVLPYLVASLALGFFGLRMARQGR
jgi:hypothetical protein